MKKYILLVLFVFSYQVFSADIHGRVVRVLDGDTIEVMLSQHPVRVRLVNIDAPEKKQDYGRWSEKNNEISGCGKNGYCHIFSARSLWSYSRAGLCTRRNEC